MSKLSEFSRISWGTALVLIALGAYFSYQAGFSKQEADISLLEDKIPLLNDQITTLETEKSTLQQKLATVERHYQIQLETGKNLENHLKSLQAHNAALTHDMTLYQTVSGSPDLAQSVQVKSCSLFPVSGNTFRYLIVLSKQFSSHEIIEGTLALTILGKVGEKEITLPVKYVESAQEEGLFFKFRHLQELSGEITLPDTFIAGSLHLSLYPQRGWPSSEQTFPWIIANS